MSDNQQEKAAALTLEQQLQFQVVQAKVAKMSEVEVKRELVAVFERMQQIDAEYRAKLKQQWGING